MTIPNKLKPVLRKISQEQIIKYANASGDFNPLHLDEQFAKNTYYGRPIAVSYTHLTLPTIYSV